MESIDPELREVPRAESSPYATEAQQAVELSLREAPRDDLSALENPANVANGNNTTTNGDDAQSLAQDGLPYFNGTVADLAAATAAPSTYQPINFTPNEPRRRPRSCESCRGLKVKCEPTDEGTCKRCAKAGRECLYTESSGRRKKKQDNKVAELEKKVSGLTAALLAQRGAEASDSMVFDESSLVQSNSQEEGSNGKRRRSEFEEDYKSSPGRAAKLQALSPNGPGVDSQVLNSLAKQPVLAEFCKNLKSLESWFKEQVAKNGTHSETNGGSNSKNDASSNSTTDQASSKKTAPTAPMGRTPLDLLSQVASNEKPSNQWYSPYANTNQDTSGYYDQNKQGKDSKEPLDAPDIEQVLRSEFGDRTGLVIGFLGSFLAASSSGVNGNES